MLKPLKSVRDLFRANRNPRSPRGFILLALILFAALGLLILLVGSVAQTFGADATTLFRLGKVLIALPMWAGVILMFSFVCRM